MGYTHYWRARGPAARGHHDMHMQETWNSLLRDCELIITDIDTHGIGIDREFDSEQQFAFDGAGERGVETFALPRRLRNMADFCKTCREPYDKLVVACLCVVGESGFLDISSDGWRDEWEEGRLLAEEILERKIKIPPGVPVRPVVIDVPREYELLGSDSS